MKKPLKSDPIRKENGRKNLPRDNTKLIILKYLLSKDTDTTSSLYEILHHAGIASYDYPYLKKILQEMAISGWIKIMISGSKGKEKSNYVLTERGRDLLVAVKNFEKGHPILDLDSFYNI